jgi:nucleotide-binding universal stress UspA family protein
LVVSYEHLLALTDGSREADRALEVASALAFEHRARLTVAAVVELEHPGHHCGYGSSVWNAVLRDAARADLDRAERLVTIPADYEILYGKHLEAIADGARALGCDAIVIPDHSHGLSRVLHKDRAAALAKRTGCAVIQSSRKQEATLERA